MVAAAAAGKIECGAETCYTVIFPPAPHFSVLTTLYLVSVLSKLECAVFSIISVISCFKMLMKIKRTWILELGRH